MNINRPNPEDAFQDEELKVYRKLLKEIKNNKDFYLSASPEEMAHSLIENCQISKEDLYKIMKKINYFERQ